MLEHSQLNERLWQCNLQENGVNLGDMTTKSANNDQRINDISLKKEENLSRFLQINKTEPRYIIIAGKGTTSIALTWFTCMLQTS
ncbi:hypothetical protein HanPSC8_Chr13g0593321 [Helianthus annuus]|nr:hypothetical protein HanPSC8_Chr13g0593321 [Helianthus annuus]